jgi:hypothetical protein
MSKQFRQFRQCTKDSLKSPCPINDLQAAWFGTPDASWKVAKVQKQRPITYTLFASVKEKRMKSALQLHSNQFKLTEEDIYATTNDFQKLFAREMTGLFRLSLNLTADAEKAESCLILAMRECFSNRAVAKEFALIWARRTVIRNAIRLVLGTKNAIPIDIYGEAGPDFHLQPSEHRIEELRDSLVVLELADFDRLVFVISVLERYSILDCALLLKKSPKEVNDARVRAISQVLSAEERNRHGSSTTFPTSLSGAGRNGIGALDGSCGSLLDEPCF